MNHLAALWSVAFCADVLARTSFRVVVGILADSSSTKASWLGQFRFENFPAHGLLGDFKEFLDRNNSCFLVELSPKKLQPNFRGPPRITVFRFRVGDGASFARRCRCLHFGICFRSVWHRDDIGCFVEADALAHGETVFLAEMSIPLH